MKTHIKFSIMLLAALLLVSCGAKREEHSKNNKTKSDSVSSSATEESYSDDQSAPGSSSKSSAMPNDEDMDQQKDEGEQQQLIPTSSSAAQVGKHDSTRKFIRVADLKFRVKDVINSTYAIEDIVDYFGGFVSSTYMESNIERTDHRKVSADSSLETTYYTISNTMVVRVPVAKLDSTLKAIALLIDFVDYRSITAEDVTLSMLRNELERKRLQLYNTRVSSIANSSSANLDSRISAEERLLTRQIEADEALIERMEMNDRIAFSQINLDVYQREVTRHDMIANDKAIDSYRPGFGHRLLEAMETGWSFLGNLLLVLVTIWPLYLLGGLVWWIIWFIKKTRKNNKA